MQPWLIGVIIGLIVTLSIVPLLQKKAIGVGVFEGMNEY
jgi:hypothetical protein